MDDLDASIITAADNYNIPHLQVIVMQRSTGNKIAMLYDDDSLGEWSPSKNIAYARGRLPLIRGVREWISSYYKNRTKYPELRPAYLCYFPADGEPHFFVRLGVESKLFSSGANFSVNDTLTMLENDLPFPSDDDDLLLRNSREDDSESDWS